MRVAVTEVLLRYPGLSQQDGAVVQRDAGAANEGGTSCVQPDIGDCFAGVGGSRSLNRNIGVKCLTLCLCRLQTCRGES